MKMSHIRECAVEIKNVNEDLAKETIKRLARTMGVDVVNEVRDAMGRTRKVLLGLKIGVGGYGIVVNNGKVEVVGDDWQQQIKLTDFRDMFLREYKSLALLKALESIGYVGEIRNEGEKNIIRAYRC